MAQGGGNQQPIFNFPITVKVDLDSKLLQSAIVEGNRHYGDQISIIDSNIGEVVAGAAQPVHDVEQPDPDNAQHGPDEPGDQGDDDLNVAEEMQHMNLATNLSTPGKKPTPAARGTKFKVSNFKNVLKESQESEKGENKDTETKQRATTSSSTPTPPATTVSQELSSGAATHHVTRPKIEFLKEQSTLCMGNSKPDYEKAAKLLEQLTKLQRESNFYTMLQLAECYLHLRRNEEANETIGKVRSLIMTSQTLSANDIETLAKDLVANSSHTRAMILFPIACDMFHANASSPDDAVNRMCECIEQMFRSVKALVDDSGKPRQIAAPGIRYQEQMYESLSSVKNAEPGNKVLNQAWALKYIGTNYDSVGEHEKILKLLLSGVELLQQHFKGKESMYRVHGYLLNNIGVALSNLGNFTEAEKYYVKSVDAYTEATDYSSESKKQEAIERSKNNLKLVRKKLGKK